MLKGKLGVPEARANRLMNRSVSCTVKNPKVEVFGYAPPSTQAGVAPFNILVGASPSRVCFPLLSLPALSGLLRGQIACWGVMGPLLGWGGGHPTGFCPQAGTLLWGFTRLLLPPPHGGCVPVMVLARGGSCCVEGVLGMLCGAGGAQGKGGDAAASPPALS